MMAVTPTRESQGDGRSQPVAPRRPRLLSVDAYRGWVMFLMLAEALSFWRVAAAKPDSAFWRLLAHHQTHATWVGCSLHDLIQPSFSFLVGVALSFSIASRAARGQSRGKMMGHAAWRSLALVFLGIFLRAGAHPLTNWTFEDTLTQIGLGYFALFFLGGRPARDQWIALAIILIGYWAAFALYPLPGPDFDYARVGLKAGWPGDFTGFLGHWQKNTNFAWAFDTWFLNLFHRVKPFAYNVGGYATLSFIPTLGTMILGLLAGGVLRNELPPRAKVRWLIIAGVIGLASGALLHALGICPVVKRIWTPSWVLFSGGWCFLFLAGFYAVVELGGWRRWAFPFVVIGANSIAAYCMAQLFDGFLGEKINSVVGARNIHEFGGAYAPILQGAGVLLILWLILFGLHRRKIFLKL